MDSRSKSLLCSLQLKRKLVLVECFIIVDLESLLKTTAHQQTKTSLDHLATPRRVVQLPPPTKNSSIDHHIRYAFFINFFQ